MVFVSLRLHDSYKTTSNFADYLSDCFYQPSFGISVNNFLIAMKTSIIMNLMYVLLISLTKGSRCVERDK